METLNLSYLIKTLILYKNIFFNNVLIINIT